MAKTIEEMAKKNAKYDTAPYCASFRNFVAGANAVLEEIESVMQYNKADERPWLLRGNHLFNELQKIIKELKGE